MYRIILGVFIVMVLIHNDNASAQRFADEMHFSPDGRRLILGNNPYKGFYESNTIRTVRFQFPQSNYWTTLTNNFPSRTDLPATVTVDGISYDSVGVRFKGNSSYSAIGTSEKKSFNISFDDWKHGQNVGGYNTIVLNNCFDDPSFLREIIFEMELSKHIPVPHGNFAHLFINGQNWGIYANVEQLNHDYEKEWFRSHNGAMWRSKNPPGAPGPSGSNGDSLASLYDFGTDTTFYAGHYYLKSSSIPDPWTRLMTAIRVLDTAATVNVESVLGDYLDIDEALWLVSSEDAFADDDSYLFKGRKDYYIYFEPETGRLIPLEMDGNDTYNVTKKNTSVFFNSTNANLPMLSKLLNKPQLRQRYLAHLRTIVKDEFNSSEQDSIIDHFYSMIDTAVYNDPKKLYTYADFVNERAVLKQWVIDRKAIIQSNTEVMETGPVISNTVFTANNTAWQRPTASDSVWVTTSAVSTSGISRVTLYTSTNLTGKFLKTVMYDDGLHHDQTAGDGIYGAVIPAKPGATWVRFYIEAAANNTAKSVSYDPEGAEHDVYIYQVIPSAAIDHSVVINEVMAKNTSTAADSCGHFEDWIELYNTSNQNKDVSGFFLTDSINNPMKWQIPQGTIIPANGYQIIWADENKREGNFHTNFRLSSSNGETLMLLNSNKELVDQVIFGAQQPDMGYARVPNGTGSFMIHPPTFSANNSAGVFAQISTADTSGCFPYTVNFANNSVNAVSYIWNFGDGSADTTAATPAHIYTAAGTYQARLIAAAGAIADTDFVTIHVYQGFTINLGPSTISTPSVTYLLDAGPGYIYSWSTSETTQTITVGADGNYCVTAVDPNGCFDVACVYVDVNSLEVENISDNNISVYPNPVNNKLTLKTGNDEIVPVKIFDSIGEEIYSADFANTIIIDTNKWADGIYFLNLPHYSNLFVVSH